MNNEDKLLSYLNRRILNNTDYKEIANLSFCLFCSVSFLPDELKPIKIDKSVIALVFSKLSKEKNLLNTNSEDGSINNIEHWINLIDSYLKKGIKPNFLNAKKIIGNDGNGTDLLIKNF